MIKNNVCVYHFLDNNNIPFYIGKTNNFKRRKNEHLCVLKKGKNGKTWPVYNKIRKLIQEENYELKMEIIDEKLTNDEANNLEIKLIKEYRENGYKLYNLTAGGDGTVNHKPVFTDEWRKKLSESKSGDKWTGNKNPFYGKRHSKETKEKISAIHKGKQTGKDNPFYGKKHNKKSKELIGNKNRGVNSGRVLKYEITSPDGIKYYIKDGLYEFCKKIKSELNIELFPYGFAHVLSGKQKTHKGWLITYLN